MKFRILFFAAILMSCFASAQNQRFMPVKQGGKAGLIDTTGAIVLNPEFDAIKFLDSRIYISVEKDGKQAIYNMVSRSFSTDYYFYTEVLEPSLFKVGNGELWGLADEKKQLLIPLSYNTIELVGGRRIVCTNGAGVDVFDRSGSLIVHFDVNTALYVNGNYIIQSNESYGLASEDGQILIQPKWESYLLNYEVIYFNNPDSVLCYYSPAKIHITGNKKTSIQFFFDFDNTPVALPFYIKTEGKLNEFFSVFRNEPRSIDFENSYIRSTPLSGYYILKNDYCFLIDSLGTNLIPRALERIDYLRDRQFTVIENGHKGIYDLDKGFVLNPDFIDLSLMTDSVTKRTWIFALTDDGWSLLNPDYSRVNGLYFRSLRLHDGAGFIAFPNSGLGMLLDTTGKPMCQPKYASISLLASGLWVAKTNMGDALLAPNGKELLPPEFEAITGRKNIVRTIKDSVTEMYEWKNNQLNQLAVYNNYRRLNVSGRNDAFTTAGKPSRGVYKWQKDSVDGTFGLWDVVSESYKIPPTYHFVRPDRRKELTLVGIWGDTTRFTIGPLSFYGSMHFGIVDQTKGRIVAPTSFAFIYFHQFLPHYDENKTPTQYYGSDRNLALAISDSGQWCSISYTGLIIKSDIQYIDRFRGTKAKAWKIDSAYVSVKSQDAMITNVNRFYSQVRGFLRPADFYTDSVVKNGEKLNIYAAKADSLLFYKSPGGPNSKAIKASVSFSPPVFVFPYVYGQYLSGIYQQFYNFSIFKPDKKYSYIDENGVMITPLDYVRAYDFSDNRALVKRKDKYGFIDPEGNMVIEEKFKKALPFSEGLAVASIKSGKMGYIDTDGNWAIDPVFREANPFSEGMAAVKPQNLYGFIDASAQMVVKPQFLRAFEFQSGTAVVYMEKGYGLIDAKGKYLLKPVFDKILPADEMGMRLATKKSRKSLVAPDGIIVAKARNIVYAGEGYYSVKKGSKQLLINSSGKKNGVFVSQIPVEYAENKVLVYSKGKYSYFNIEGEKLLGPFSRATVFCDGRAIVSNRQKTMIINEKGSELHYLSTFGAVRAEPFDSVGIAIVYRGGYYMLVDTAGVVFAYSDNKPVKNTDSEYLYFNNNQQMIFDAKTKRSKSLGFWNSIDVSSYGRFRVMSEGLYGFADLCGKYFVKPQYTRIVKWSSDIYQIHYGDQVGYIHKNGKIIWALSR